MRNHLRFAALAVTLLSLAAAPALAHSTSPPGPAVQQPTIGFYQAQHAAFVAPVLMQVSAELLKQVPQRAPRVEHASDITPAAEASQPAFATVRRQRARVPTRSRLTSQGFHYRLIGSVLMPHLYDASTGRYLEPGEVGAG